MLFCSNIKFKEYTRHHDDHCNNTSCRTDPATTEIKALFDCFCMNFATYFIDFTVFDSYFNSLTNPAELNMSIEKYGNASSVFGEHFKGVKSACIAGPTVIPKP